VASGVGQGGEHAYNPAALDPVGRSWATPPPWVGDSAMKSTYPANGGAPEQLTALPEPMEPQIDHDMGSPDPEPYASQPPMQAPYGSAASSAAYSAALPPDPADASPADPPPYQPGWQPPVEPADEHVPPPVFPASTPTSGAQTWSKPSASPGFAFDDPAPAEAAAVPPNEPAPSGRITGRPIDGGPPPQINLQSRPPAAGKPEWKGSRRGSAFAAVRGKPRISPIVIGFFALLIGALVLFLLPGFLAGGSGKTPHPSVSIAAGSPTPVPTATPQNYTVKGGDTLGKIASKFGVTIEQMACYNNLHNVNTLSIGQQLLIPPSDYECPPKTPKPKPSK
jgi:hypothetical protein